MLKENFELYEVGERFFSVFPEKERKSDYDFKANFYDFVAANTLFNRLVLGNSIENYNRFCEKGLNESNGGFVLDAGCGSLVFTADAYSRFKNSPVLLLDRSLKMLKKAHTRLIKINGKIPENVFLIQADIFNLPFRENIFSVINSHGMLHLFSNFGGFLSSLNTTLSGNGKIFALVLLGENVFGKILTNIAKITGEFGFALTGEKLNEKIVKLGYKTNYEIIGNVGYFEILKLL